MVESRSPKRSTKPMKLFALYLIRFYQRWLSPHKGFVCAYRHHTGCGSCSALGHRAIRLFGVWKGIAVIRARLVQCGRIYEKHRKKTSLSRHLHAQRGDCDLDCGGCDGVGCDVPDFDCNVSKCWPKGSALDIAETAVDLAGDLPEKSKPGQKNFVQKTRAWPNRKRAPDQHKKDSGQTQG